MVDNGSLSKTAVNGGAGTRSRASGVAMSLLLLLYRASKPNIAVLGRDRDRDRWDDLVRHPDGEQAPGGVVVRVESGLFFASADQVVGTIRRRAGEDGERVVVLDAETVPYVDVTAAEALLQLRAELERDGVRLVIARGVGQVRDILRRAGSETDAHGDPVVYPTVGAAVAAAEGEPRG
jgi:MFS superfamily sulfate permease-like transporter